MEPNKNDTTSLTVNFPGILSHLGSIISYLIGTRNVGISYIILSHRL